MEKTTKYMKKTKIKIKDEWNVAHSTQPGFQSWVLFMLAPYEWERDYVVDNFVGFIPIRLKILSFLDSQTFQIRL